MIAALLREEQRGPGQRGAGTKPFLLPQAVSAAYEGHSE